MIFPNFHLVNSQIQIPRYVTKNHNYLVKRRNERGNNHLVNNSVSTVSVESCELIVEQLRATRAGSRREAAMTVSAVEIPSLNFYVERERSWESVLKLIFL